MVIATDGPGKDDCPEAAHAARKLKSAGILTLAVFGSERCEDRRCLRSVASSRRYLYDIENFRGLEQVFGRLEPDLFGARVRLLTVVETFERRRRICSGQRQPAGRARSGWPYADLADELRATRWCHVQLPIETDAPRLASAQRGNQLQLER